MPLDAPLVHLGGITTGKWARRLEPEGPTIMSWAINNHWLVNFKASQGGRIPLRYRLTTHAGPADPAAAARFAAEASRAADRAPRHRADRRAGATASSAVDPGSPVLVTAKPGEDEGWIALRLQNLSRQKARPTLTFTRAPKRGAAERSDRARRARRSASTAASSASTWSRSRSRPCS